MRIVRVAGGVLAAGTIVAVTAPVALAASAAARAGDAAAPAGDAAAPAGDPDGRGATLAAYPKHVNAGESVRLTLTCPRGTSRAQGWSAAGRVHFHGRTENVLTGVLQVGRHASGAYSVRATCVGGNGRQDKGRTAGRDDARGDGRGDGHGDAQGGGRDEARSDGGSDGGFDGRRDGRDQGRHGQPTDPLRQSVARTTVYVSRDDTYVAPDGSVRTGSGGSLSPANTAEVLAGATLATAAYRVVRTAVRRGKAGGES